MAFSAADLATLERAIAAGTLTVRLADGRTITYQSMDALMQARALVASEVSAAVAPNDRRAYSEFTR